MSELNMDDDRAAALWNAQADQHNQWSELDADEKAAWIAKCAAPVGEVELPALPEPDVIAYTCIGDNDAYSPQLVKQIVAKRDERIRVLERELAERKQPAAWGRVETVGDMVRNLLTLDQSTPIHAAFHIDYEGERRCRTRPVSISRERVIDGKWVDMSRKDVPYAVIVWAKQDERAQQPAQSIDTPEFRRLMYCWDGVMPPLRSQDNSWATLIAYIDGRAAGAAPVWQPIETAPANMASRLYLVGGFCVQGFVDAAGELMVQSEVSPHWRKMRGKPTHWSHLPAAPSHQPGKEGGHD